MSELRSEVPEARGDAQVERKTSPIEPTSDTPLRDRFNDVWFAKPVAINEAKGAESRRDVSEPDDVEKRRKEYIDDLKKNSEYPETIEDTGKPYEKISPEKNAEMRDEFTLIREKLIKEWEEKNGKEWPRYTEDLYLNGKLIRKTGDRYDAHHIQPLSFGGKNEASNLTPISAEKHFDRQGVHALDSPYGQLEKAIQEVSKS